MTTEEKLSPRVISIFCIILGLLFSSFVVSNNYIELIYFVAVLVFLFRYISLKKLK